MAADEQALRERAATGALYKEHLDARRRYPPEAKAQRDADRADRATEAKISQNRDGGDLSK